MILFVNCQNCKHTIKTAFHAPDRKSLLAGGKETEITCPNCGDHRSYSINNIYAEESPVVFLTTFLITMVIAITLYSLALKYDLHGLYAVGAAGVIPVLIFSIVNAVQKRKLSKFNDVEI